MTDHCTAAEIAAYVDGTAPPAARARLEDHCAECDACRTELIEVTRLVGDRTPSWRWAVPLGVAAAAALLLFARPVARDLPQYREPAVTTTVAPLVVAPRGATSAVTRLVWTTVPHADRYRLTLFDDAGSVVWETETTGTVAPLPDTLRLQPLRPYFWKVEAQTGWNRWVGSDLTEFSVTPERQ
jgi:anti-sigma factor RsiW